MSSLALCHYNKRPSIPHHLVNKSFKTSQAKSAPPAPSTATRPIDLPSLNSSLYIAALHPIIPASSTLHHAPHPLVIVDPLDIHCVVTPSHTGERSLVTHPSLQLHRNSGLRSPPRPTWIAVSFSVTLLPREIGTGSPSVWGGA